MIANVENARKSRTNESEEMIQNKTEKAFSQTLPKLLLKMTMIYLTNNDDNLK